MQNEVFVINGGRICWRHVFHIVAVIVVRFMYRMNVYILGKIFTHFDQNCTRASRYFGLVPDIYSKDSHIRTTSH